MELESSGLCCLHDCLVGSIGLGGLDLLDVVSFAEETRVTTQGPWAAAVGQKIKETQEDSVKTK